MSEDRIFITGATGFIGSHLLDLLLSKGYKINALYRSSKAVSHPDAASINWYKGDILDFQSLENAIKGCRFVIHAAAFAKTWLPDHKIIILQNVQGTENVLKASLREGITRVVYVSSAGIYSPSHRKVFINESTQMNDNPFIPYDESKILAEKIVKDFVNMGLPVITVNPTRVYGPGIVNEANSVTKMILDYISGNWKWMPSKGNAIGNYVYVSDVANGILKALTRGTPGENYILGGENCSFNVFFKKLQIQSHLNFKLWKIPTPVMFFAAFIMVSRARLTGSSPKITPGLVRKFLQDWVISSEKAEKTLDYTHIGLEEGFLKTLQWFSSNSIQNGK